MAMPGRHHATGAVLVKARDTKVLATAVPRREIEGDGREDDRVAAVRERVCRGEYAERNQHDIDRHAPPQAAAGYRIVGRTEVKLAQENIRNPQFPITPPIQHQDEDEKQQSAAGADEPEIAGFGD
jgi:hypothetical protein